MTQSDTSTLACDIAVIGAGPAGLAASVWAARYRRRVVLIDAGEHRNRWTDSVHGYLGLERSSPSELLERARHDLDRYRSAQVLADVRVVSAHRDDACFHLQLDDGRTIQALRIIIATGVRDVFPSIDRFEEFYGKSIFTCPSCDGYEAREKNVVAIGNDAQIAPFAIGLLDWSTSITVVTSRPSAEHAALADHGIGVVLGVPTELLGDEGELHALRLDSGEVVSCDMVFWNMQHRQQSDLAEQLGCEISADGSVVVDDRCQTSVDHVYAAGDMTPGPHLVQVAASKGAVAGIAAAVSMHGQPETFGSPPPAPDADAVLAGRPPE